MSISLKNLGIVWLTALVITAVTAWSGPAFAWHTFRGSSYEDRGQSVAVDGNGDIYITGSSIYNWGEDPVQGFASTDNFNVFVLKLSGTDGLKKWHTFLGSASQDYGYGISLDGNGNVYVTGTSHASWGTAPSRPYSGGIDAFAAKLSADTGQLLKHTFLGATNLEDSGQGIVARNGKVYVVGKSAGSWLNNPPNEPVRGYSGAKDAFIARLDSADLSLDWYTFLGSHEAEDHGQGLTVDGLGNVYVVGTSPESWGTPRRPHSSTGRDAFVAKLNAGGALQWNTFLGSGGQFHGQGITVDGTGNTFVTGYGDGEWTEQPLRGYAGGGDAFVAKLDGNGYYQWHTFLGSEYDDRSLALTLDGLGQILITGESSGSWAQPLRAFSGPAGEASDAFVAKMKGTGELIWNTFLGGSGYDQGRGIVVDGSDQCYVTGDSRATWGNPVWPFNGLDDYDIFVVQLSYYTISGMVMTLGNVPLGGVTIMASTGESTVTDQNGYYQLTFAQGWNGTVTPSLNSYTFTPASITFVDLVQNRPDQDFNTSGSLYTLSGRITEAGAALAGVTVTATPGGTTVTGDNGDYQITVTEGWSGTITPGQEGYAFTPANYGLASVSSPRANLNFSADWGVYVSGHIADNLGRALAGVPLSGLPKDPITGADPVTDSSGDYRVRVRYNWSGTVTPLLDRHSFSPSETSYSNVVSERTAQDYVGTPAYIISGSVKEGETALAGVTLRLSTGGSVITDPSGNFQVTVNGGWSGTITPSLPGYSFSDLVGNLPSLAFDSVARDLKNQDFRAVWMIYIRGTILNSQGTPLGGVLLGGLPGSPQSNSDGTYRVRVGYSWSGTVTPVLNGYTFYPPAWAHSNVIAETGYDYTGVPTYIISGLVKEGSSPLEGVTVTAHDGSTTMTAVTDRNGFFQMTFEEGWEGVLTPAQEGYSFSPHPVGPLTANHSLPDFIGTWLIYINGLVTKGGGAGLGGVVLTNLPGNPATGPDGSYRARVSYNWSGTVRPILAGYTFSPESKTYSLLHNELIGENYSATPVPICIIAGQVKGNGAALSGVLLSVVPGVLAVTDETGHYQIEVNKGWSGTITPSALGYAFSPPTRAYDNLLLDRDFQDFFSGSRVCLPLIWKP